jgi:hypothetical protein
MKSIVLDVVSLLPHVPGNFQSFLDERNCPSPASVLLLKGVDTSLLCVGPFVANASKQKLVPSNLVLFLDGMPSAPLVMVLEPRECTVAMFPPLLESSHDSPSHMGGCF